MSLRRRAWLLAVAAALLPASTVATRAMCQAAAHGLVEEMRLDGAREDFSTPLGFVLVGRDERLIVAELTSFQLRFYDRTGKMMASAGRRGTGPGEFGPIDYRGGQRAEFIGGLVGDSVWVWESHTRRVSIFTDAGRFVRGFVVPAADWASDSRGRATPTQFSFRPQASVGDGTYLGAAVPFDGPSVVAAPAAVTSLVRVAPGASSHRVLARIPAAATVAVTDRRTNAVVQAPVQFSPRPVHAFAPGAQWLALATVEAAPKSTSGVLVLRIIRSTGEEIVARRHPWTGTTVSPARAEAVLGQMKADLSARRGGGRYDDATLDDLVGKMRDAMPSATFPSGPMLIGPDGCIWLYSGRRDESSLWSVFDSRGEIVGEVAAPGTRFVAQAVSCTNIWAMRGDDDGFPHVVRYRVNPPFKR